MLTEQLLLEDINRDLPVGVDWKSGADSYLKQLVERGGPSFRQWHLTKPFLGELLAGEPLHGDASTHAVDPYVTYHELYGFLNAIRAADLPPGARILDVGCGPGWTSHYLGKMGYAVLGVDLSEDLLDLAQERVSAEPFPPFPKTRLDVRFVRHDVESAPLGDNTDGLYDLALLDSVLHHFYNPVAALRNVGWSLRPGALVAIIEALRPDGAPIDPHNMAIMNRYHTIERPYTRRQLSDILRLSQFPYHVHLRGVNGVFSEHELGQPLAPGPTAVILGAREAHALGRWGQGGLVYQGFHDEEHDSEGPFRWAGPSSSVVLDGREYALTLTSPAVDLGRPVHDIFVSIEGKLETKLRLTDSERRAHFETGPLPAGSRLWFVSDFSFCPRLLGLNEDSRILAFQLRLTARG